ncbi:MAG: ADP-ribosylglycohydrolase family protein [Gammaproteobacteria bacterium]|nr:ADP-ribosylglycohydrolase family protein [Gammaproteobacteria bacterium]
MNGIGTIERSQGCLLGQLAGDSLGSLVEFQTPEQIQYQYPYPEGVRFLADGGTFNTIAGQPTDDSEMALSLARMLIDKKSYYPEDAKKSYQYWLSTMPFDCGTTVRKGLNNTPDCNSQANGALMRIAPLGIFGVNYQLQQVAHWAKQDASITHPNIVCRQVNALFTMAIAYSIKNGVDNNTLYKKITSWAYNMKAEKVIIDTIHLAESRQPSDYIHHQGWVLIAFQNALYQLLHASGVEEGIVDSIMQGGDTDTNAAICGALLGSVYSKKAIPQQWIDSLLNCRPEEGHSHIHHPRPTCFWPVDVMEIAENLITA